MKQILVLLSFGLLFFIGCGKKADHDHAMNKNTKMSATESAANEIFVYYTCPMESHKNIHSREPGKCSECGMAMVQAVVTSEENMEYWGCPMEAHGQVRKDQPGSCENCGMKLKPMRLDKS